MAEAEPGAKDQVQLATSEQQGGEAVAEQPAPEGAVPTMPKVVLPMQMFVRGGTQTSADERRTHDAWVDAEKRRDIAAAEKTVCSFPVEEGGGKMYTHEFAAPGTQELPKAYVLLRFVNSRGEPVYDQGVPLECLTDIIAPDAPAFKDELMLLICCPVCHERYPLGDSIMQVRQSNRSWHLDMKHAGELIVFEGRPYKSAGHVMDSEGFTCRCGTKWRIDKNKIWKV